MQLQWKKGPAEQWCALDTIDLNAVELNCGEQGGGVPQGVFVIWRGAVAQRMTVVLYVGRGVLRRELADCRRDPLFRGEQGLRVTWATVKPAEVDGVAAYLYEQLQPVWGEVVPSVPPMPVNLPMAKRA